ncbi:MAG: hypothetical protein H6701_05315 [Myxococcales bacterium]|nr:hypothetical protein [Myxococcales bacterium]
MECVRSRWAAIAMFVASAWAGEAAAEPLIYEGRLAGLAAGEQVSLRFALYDAEEGGADVWLSAPMPVAGGDGGHFVAALEDGPRGRLRPDHFRGARWLEVTVLPPGGAAVVLTPRQRIGRVPLSFDGMTISGATRRDDGRWVHEMRVSCDPDPPAGHFHDVSEALAWLSDKRIATDTVVEIRVVSRVCGAHPPIEPRHRDGDRIEILGGAPGEALRPQLFFEGSGLLVADGARLGRFAGFHLVGPGTGRERDRGVVADTGGWVGVDDVIVEGFHECYRATGGGVIWDATPVVDSPLVATGCRDGFAVSSEGIIRAQFARSVGNEGLGFQAALGGMLSAPHAVAEGNQSHGFLAQSGALAYVDYGASVDNAAIGFQASSNATMDATRTMASGNRSGYFAYSTGALMASSSQSVENAYGALWAERLGYLHFACEAGAAPAIVPPAVPPGNGVNDIHAVEGGVIDARNCPRVASGVTVEGMSLQAAGGQLNHPDASAPACCAP